MIYKFYYHHCAELRKFCLQGWPLTGIWELGFKGDFSTILRTVSPQCETTGTTTQRAHLGIHTVRLGWFSFNSTLFVSLSCGYLC